jgi:DNA-binding MurR/RpiR family transcriptional regulator
VRDVTGRSVQANVAAVADSLPESQRRVAELVVRDPEAVAFGTVSSVAERTGTSNPTVIRFASQLGFDGFTALRDAVRDELSAHIQSAIGRVHRPSSDPLLRRALGVEVANVERTLEALDDATLERVTSLLADVDRRIWLLPNTQTEGVVTHVAEILQLCRPRVVLLTGTEFRIATALARLQPGDVLVSVDTQRHERWLVRVQRSAVHRGAVPLALTDRLPCSLDLSSGLAVTFACDTTGPFESQVGLLALANTLISAVVERLRPEVATRVERLERTWVDEHMFEG